MVNLDRLIPPILNFNAYLENLSDMNYSMFNQFRILFKIFPTSVFKPVMINNERLTIAMEFVN